MANQPPVARPPWPPTSQSSALAALSQPSALLRGTTAVNNALLKACATRPPNHWPRPLGKGKDCVDRRQACYCTSSPLFIRGPPAIHAVAPLSGEHARPSLEKL
jgi:hypothetical protein